MFRANLILRFLTSHEKILEKILEILLWRRHNVYIWYTRRVDPLLLFLLFLPTKYPKYPFTHWILLFHDRLAIHRNQGHQGAMTLNPKEVNDSLYMLFPVYAHYAEESAAGSRLYLLGFETR